MSMRTFPFPQDNHDLDDELEMYRNLCEEQAKEIKYRTEECSDLFDVLEKYREENPIIIAEYKPAIRRLRKENKELKEEIADLHKQLLKLKLNRRLVIRKKE